MKKNIRLRSKVTSLAAASVVATTIAGVAPIAAQADNMFTFRSLGSGSELRTSILINVTDPVATPTPDSKTGEGKCGEGKCG